MGWGKVGRGLKRGLKIAALFGVRATIRSVPLVPVALETIGLIEELRHRDKWKEEDMGLGSDAKQAGNEIGDLVVLLVDGTPNKEQIQQFVGEGFQAAMSVAAVKFTPETAKQIAAHIAEGILEKLNSTVFQLPD